MRRAVSKPRDPEDDCRPGAGPDRQRKPNAKRQRLTAIQRTVVDGLRAESAQIPIRATLISSNSCEALGIIVRGRTPVLDLCRALFAAGHDRRPLHAYRGNVLALIIHSTGAAAQLRVATHGLGFERIAVCTGGPSVRQNGPTIVRVGSKGEHAYAAAAKRQISRASRGRRR
jgi:hypothetical protein